MPRVTFVKAARKDNRCVSKGESYYWWKFRFGGKHMSKTRPRPSQLTQSAFYGTVLGLVEMVEDYEITPGEEGSVEGLVDDVRGQLEDLQSETQDAFDNIPESLQYAPTGELVQERVYSVENAISELDSIEEPEQWDEERTRITERDDWLEAEPQAEDFELDADGDDTDFRDAKETWLGEEPDELEGFEEFDIGELSDAINSAQDAG